MKLQELFLLGMKREIGELIEPDLTNAINLGAGNSHIPGTVSLDFPAWDGSRDPLPYADNSVSSVFAFHFLEHLTGAQVIEMLREIQRVLVPGGTAQIVVPYYKANIAFQDLDHKAFFTEETWRTLFRNPYYNKNREEPWVLFENVNVIIGVVERNLSLMTQLVKRV